MSRDLSNRWIEGDFDGDFEGAPRDTGDPLGSAKTISHIFRGRLKNARPSGPPGVQPSTPDPDVVRQSLIPEVYASFQGEEHGIPLYEIALADVTIGSLRIRSIRDGDPTQQLLLGRVQGRLRGRLVRVPKRTKDHQFKGEKTDNDEIGQPQGNSPESWSNRKADTSKEVLDAENKVRKDALGEDQFSTVQPPDTLEPCRFCRLGMIIALSAFLGAICWFLRDGSSFFDALLLFTLPVSVACIIGAFGSIRMSVALRQILGWTLIALFILLSWKMFAHGLWLGCIAGYHGSALALSIITLLSGLALCWVRATLTIALLVVLLVHCFHGENECAVHRDVGKSLPFETPLQVVQPDEPIQVQTNQSPPVNIVNDQSPEQKINEPSEALGLVERSLNAMKRLAESVVNWFREVRDSQADEVDRLNEAGFTMVDGLKRISLEKALAAPKRYLDCERSSPTGVLSSKYSVYLGEAAMFELNSAELGPKAQSRLHKLGKLISAAGDKPYLIAGHADRSGISVNNYYLSQDRANAVASWLADAGYTDINKLTIRGEGDRIPIIPVDTAESANRRVEIRVDCDRMYSKMPQRR